MKKGKPTSVIRKAFKSLFPIQAMAVGLTAVNSLLTSFIVGNYIGSEALAAIGFVSPFLMIVSTVSMVISTGSQLLCGRCLGEGNEKGVRQVLSTAIIACVPAGLLFLLLSTFALPVASLLGAKGDCLQNTADYLRGVGFGIVFNVLSTCLLPFLQLDRRGGRVTAAVAAMLFTGIGFNLLNVFVLNKGLLGAGLAYTAGNVALCLVALPAFLFKSKTFRFSFSCFSRSALKQIAKEGLPAAVRPVSVAARNRIINGCVFAVGGTVAMSAMAVANTLTEAFGCVVEGGYTSSGRLVASVLAGERDTSSLRSLSKEMFSSAWYLYVIAYAIVFFFAKPLAILLGAEPENIATYVLAIRVFNIWFLTNAFQSPPFCIYQAIGETKLVTLFNFLGGGVYASIFALLFRNSFAMIMFTTCISELCQMIVFTIIFRIRAGRMPRSIFELVDVPSRLSAPRENRLKATICTVEDAVRASQEAVEFCLRKEMTGKMAYFCGLCIEEMTVFTVQQRFPNDPGSTGAVDLRMLYENGELHIMLRDDCSHFDPAEWLELYSEEEPSRSIGIRMVTKLAKDMSCNGALGMNVITMTL